jgi:hypothetical protein
MNLHFAFNLLAGEEARERGRLTILQARMNPDLATTPAVGQRETRATSYQGPDFTCALC